ncbi:MAG: serine/threonine-protein kinase [Thermoguttaceae bacterium]
MQPDLPNTADSSPAAGISEAGARIAGGRAAGAFFYASGSRPLEGYTLKRGVGQGGFGEIYYATSDAGKEVALKLVRRNLDVELRGIRQCLNLKHPNLLNLFDIRQDAHGDTWVVMEYIAGRCLEDVLADHPSGLPPGEVLAWVHGIGAGLAYLHDRGIVHRDLKPGNVFSDEGIVKIGDYGLSKFISCSRRSGHTESIGTVHYMAPEVATGRYGKEIDIYALGVMLYEMLTGRVPFDGESVGEVLMKHLTAQPDVSMLAEPYRSIVARALQKDPERRFGSVGQMLAALPGGGGTVSVGGATFSPLPPGAAPASGCPGVRVPLPRVSPAAAVPPPPPRSNFSQAIHKVFPPGEEPIARGIRSLGRKFDAAWAQRTLLGKILLLIPLLLLMPLAIYLSIPLTIAYLFYRFVRMLVLTPDPGPDRGPRTAVRAPPPTTAPPARPPTDVLPAIPAIVLSARDRFTELVGSLLAAAVIALAMSAVMIIIVIRPYHRAFVAPEQYAWVALVGILGAWGVLVLDKLWEGRFEEAMPRRFILMVFGLGLGLAASLVAETLLVDLPREPGFVGPASPVSVPPSLYADGRPHPMAYMAVFGTLLALLRWWRQADRARDSRLRLWSLAVSCLAALVVAGLWDFPQPWLVMVAGVMSVSVQLASPWVPHRARLRPQRKTMV